MTNDKALHFNIQYIDLVRSKQDELFNELYPQIEEEVKNEGEEFLNREWHEPKPRSWQEAYVRIYAIESNQWTDDIENTPQFMWETWQEEHVVERTNTKLDNAFKQLELEIEL
jgi:hypothetical protein